MKWHNMGQGKVQLRLGIVVLSDFFLCRGYVKSNENVDKREMAKLKTGIPQPSLNRFFDSASMPHRTTLYRIANALEITESKIISKWAA